MPASLKPLMDLPRVTVSIVSHQQAAMAHDLLKDLQQHCSARIDKVVFTSNLHEQLPFALEAFGFPVQLLVNDKPKGFGANQNQAFQHCQSDWFLILNPDVRISSDVMSALLARAHPKTAMLAPQEYSKDGERVDNLRGLITPLELLERILFKKVRRPPAKGGWLKGMFMLTRSSAYRQIDGFNERYFMYCEDFDLCARLMLEGWEIDHHDDLGVVHIWQRDSHGLNSLLGRHLLSLGKMWLSGTYWRILWRQSLMSPSGKAA